MRVTIYVTGSAQSQPEISGTLDSLSAITQSALVPMKSSQLYILYVIRVRLLQKNPFPDKNPFLNKNPFLDKNPPVDEPPNSRVI